MLRPVHVHGRRNPVYVWKLQTRPSELRLEDRRMRYADAMCTGGSSALPRHADPIRFVDRCQTEGRQDGSGRTFVLAFLRSVVA